MRRTLLLIFLTLLAGRAGADTIHLENGGKFEGQVIEKTETEIRFRTVSGIETTIPRANIRRIVSGPIPEKTRAAEARRKKAKNWDEGHEESCPLDCPRCERLFHASLNRICASVDRAHPLAPMPVKLGGWAPLQAPTACILGLVLLGEGNTPKSGPDGPTLRKLVAYVQRIGTADEPAYTQFRTWILTFGTLFLSEVERVDPHPKRAALIAKMVKLLESGLKPGKGWDHGLKRARGGYGPFTGITIWAVAALGAAKERGIPVSDNALAEGIKILRKSFGRRKFGAWYFADRWTTIAPGRTAGAVWALMRYGDVDRKSFKRAARLITKHVRAVPDGHASGMMSFGWGALGAEMLGGSVRETFWRTHRITVLRNREASGFFLPQKWRDLGYFDFDIGRRPFVGKGTTWPDHTYGKGWATPWMLLAWQLGRGKSVFTTTAPAPSWEAGARTDPPK